MQQYLRIKGEHPEEILLFRLGDFYETFFDDAKTAARALDIVLTSRNSADGEDAIPLAGFPAHAAEGYISRLLKAGLRVAVCDQVEDPKQARGLVKREVVEVLSTGTALSDGFLTGARNNYLMVLVPPDGDDRDWGLAIADVSTGEFVASDVPHRALPDEIQRYEPTEIVIPESMEEAGLNRLRGAASPTVTRLEGFRFSSDLAEQTLKEHFGVSSLKGFGAESLTRGIGAAGALIGYLQSSRVSSLGHMKRLRIRHGDEGMMLDAATQRNLELVSNLRDGSRSGTVLDVIDHTQTAMGTRALRNALLRPLNRVDAIRQRHGAVDSLVQEPDLRDRAREALDGLGDLERLAVRVETGKATPKDMTALRAAQDRLPLLKELLCECESQLLAELGDALDPTPELVAELSAAIMDDPPVSRTDGGIFRPGYSKELDRVRELASSGKNWIAELQQSERERTGIPSLKVGYNKVFGYYLEVTRTHLEKVPEDYIRKQTLVSAERFITPGLKEKEEEVLGAEEKSNQLEYDLFESLCRLAAKSLPALQANAVAVGMIDMLAGFSEAAVRHSYVRPDLSEDGSFVIEEGRHPVVEAMMPRGNFIPNDTRLSTDQQIAIVTGPNMAGKSTYLRQVGLVCLLSQTGSFVPAARAHLPVVDRIFTRVGASDNLAGGESTFLVEMHETANILHNATAESLVLLDEVGRGTSTYDGLSIAWALAEYLHSEVGAKTVFATHYHELTALADRLARVFNLNVAVKEWGEKVIFLHKIVPGGCDHSYGIHVAELAGVPEPVIERARHILQNLEEDRPLPEGEGTGTAASDPQTELFSGRSDPLLEALRDVDPNRMTPLEALSLLARLKDLI
jgi:DNA mismatch repair protein MutS